MSNTNESMCLDKICKIEDITDKTWAAALKYHRERFRNLSDIEFRKKLQSEFIGKYVGNNEKKL